MDWWASFATWGYVLGAITGLAGLFVAIATALLAARKGRLDEIEILVHAQAKRLELQASEIEELKQEITSLTAENERLTVRVKTLEAENETLRCEIKELRGS